MKVKGTILQSRQHYLQQQCTPEQRIAVLKRLDPDVRETYQKKILASKWYPALYFHSMNKAIVTIVGKGNVAILRDLSAFGAELSVKGIYRVILLLASPDLVFKKYKLMWSQHFTSGQVEHIVLGRKRTKIAVRYYEGPKEELAQILLGWCTKITELCGGKDIRCELQQDPDPETTCIIHVSWK